MTTSFEGSAFSENVIPSWIRTIMTLAFALACLTPRQAFAERGEPGSAQENGRPAGVELERCSQEQFDPARCAPIDPQPHPSPPPPIVSPTPTPDPPRRRWVRDLDRTMLWTARVAGGAGFYLEQVEDTAFDLDVTTGLLFALTNDNLYLGVWTEVGYTRHGGDDAAGHSFTAGMGLRAGMPLLSASIFTSVLIGGRDDRLDIGGRYGIRLESLSALVAIEVSHELRDNDIDAVQSVRLLLSLDFGILLSALIHSVHRTP